MSCFNFSTVADLPNTNLAYYKLDIYYDKIDYSKMIKNGFTLVELAIVLVIIGLLIGGILVAKSMINTSKIQATVRQLAQFDTSVENFRTRYNALPGDNTLFPSGYGTANDGKISGYNASDGYWIGAYTDITSDVFGGESGHFWYELKLIGLKEEDGKTYTDYSGSDANAENHTPAIKINNRTNWIGIAFDTTAANGNFYVAQNFTSMTSTSDDLNTANTGSINAVDALAIDKKIDDGLDLWSANAKVFTINMPYACDDGSNGYNLSSASLCQLAVRMGISTGTTQ